MRPAGGAEVSQYSTGTGFRTAPGPTGNEVTVLGLPATGGSRIFQFADRLILVVVAGHGALQADIVNRKDVGPNHKENQEHFHRRPFGQYGSGSGGQMISASSCRPFDSIRRLIHQMHGQIAR